MDKFEALKVFTAVAEEGSFVAASRALGVSAPAVTRSVARLEQSLGVALFHRTTRAVRLSESGKRYLSDISAVLSQLDAADAAMAGSYGEPQGLLKLTAPVLFGQNYVVPVVSEYLATYPATDVHCVLVDRVVNLLEENLDIAVRLGELPDSSLFFKRLGSIRKVTCAAPDYLSQHGHPETPRDLKVHQIVQSTAVEATTVWQYGDERVRVRPRLRCNQNGAAVVAAETGAGVSRLMSYQVGEALAAGRLVLVLEDFEPPPIPVNLVYLDGRNTTARIRSFVDLAAARLAQVL